jgi:hypothetical protein
MKQLCAILLLRRSFITPKGQLQKKKERKKEGKCPTRKMNSKRIGLWMQKMRRTFILFSGFRTWELK